MPYWGYGSMVSVVSNGSYEQIQQNPTDAAHGFSLHV